jgi:signal transduction histidine kinase
LSQSIPYVLPLVAAGLLMSGVIVMAVPQRAVPGVRWFIVFSAALVVWTLGYAAEFLVPSLGGKVLTAKLQYVGVTVVPAAWLAFSVEYAGVARWSRPLAAGVITIPTLTLLLAWTNGMHGLVWSELGLTSGLPYTVLSLTYGPWFWVHFATSYLYLLAATALLVRVVFVRPPLFRRQAMLMLLACLSPWLGNALYVAELGPPSLDLTPFAFAFSGILAGWAILRWKLLSIGPIARDTIVEGLSEAVVVVGREGRVVDVNPAALEVLRLPSDRVIGWDAREALGRFAEVLDDPAGSRRPVSGPDGERIFDCQVDALLDGKGRPRGWTLVLHDVTARAAESAALAKARDLADETARAQRAFLANMNHELRTPLNGVMGMLQLLIASDLDGEQRSYAEIANSSAEELLTLLARILDFTTIEAGKLELDERAFDPGEVLLAAVTEYRDAAESKGLRIALSVADELPQRVVGDGVRFGQVLHSLVCNAVKFTDAGAVDVEATVDDAASGVVTVRVEVRDTGIGIPADRLESVFDGFVQADGSSTRRHEGAGLGLAVSRKLSDHMGGQLGVTSEEGRGASFWFAVPFRVSDSEAA